MKIDRLVLIVLIVLAAGTAVFSASLHTPLRAQEPATPYAREALQQRFLADRHAPQNLPPLSETFCIDGSAAGYPCANLHLQSFLPLNAMGGSQGNDIWGWTDPQTGREYALMGLNNVTAFVDITNPTQPRHLGNLLTHTSSSVWRDIKVYADHAFIVSEANGHGMQVFDLTQLRDVENPPVNFSETAHYGEFGSAHNIVINPESGFAYAVGAKSCGGGLHMIDIRTPTAPQFAGCFQDDGYTHDAQCVIYRGPDADYQGREICFNANEDTLTLVDVTVKTKPELIARAGYADAAYTHQGWLTEDHAYFLLDDELDETESNRNTRTYIWDMADLDAPRLIGTHEADISAIDHNLYVRDGLVYQANYRGGLRVLDLAQVALGQLTEVAYFDIYPANDNPSYNGAWSVYPFFASGNIIVSGIEQGLYVLRLDFSPPPTPTPSPTPEATPTATPPPPAPSYRSYTPAITSP